MMTTDAHIPIQPIHDCWNRIGVTGDHSCDKLRQYVHCRNCDVYAGAAQRNLQRPVGAGYQREWAEHFRQAADTGAQHDSSCLVFRLGREWLALPTSIFVSVAPRALPHRLPHRDARGLAGVVNVGGKLYPCIALGALLDIDDTENVARTGRHTFPRLLLVQWEGQAYALPVADLHGIVRYASGAVLPPAATINKGLQRYLTGVLPHEDMQIGCLDAGLLGYQLARALR
ncbi:chemotaxis protein CheW [Pseudoduganella namucuonensis]|uniref:Chemotaxis protein CheW n=1 Tax=Pseudoduganella namucuonensis TaxID=1035707 RepID=A0A1I7M6B7_9BURK|nr:chemotaxis protein CheW [Pseudoduganella namucuonensis]SFV17484.1 chemotaxis-related protein WspD [Pseudoduganella namucuonensis]